MAMGKYNMSDVRDNTRIKTLPEDLQDVANKMLQKKFGLAHKGDVVEKEKPGLGQLKNKVKDRYGFRYGATPIQLDADRFDTATEAAAMINQRNMSLEQWRKLGEMMRDNKPTEYGMTAEEWVRNIQTDEYFRQKSYNALTMHYTIYFEGIHTGTIYQCVLDRVKLSDTIDPVMLVRQIQQKVQHELLEPTIIRGN